ncbi:MAG TPA: pitrilysin family protein [Xanthobacteraceae bacterium]|nr:pitrilysin family protein [Xanthobacteraceae bacterium]
MTRGLVFLVMTLALISTTPAFAAASRVEKIMTPAGIEVWLVRDKNLPMISLDFAFLGGAAQDPADKPGVANLVAGLLDEGAGDLDAAAYHERLEERAISLSFGANRDNLRGSIRTLSESRDEAFELLRLALTAPRFDSKELERVRAAVLAQLRRRSTNPSDIAADHWFARAFPGHPYGRPTQGTLESVPKITVDDLRTYVGRMLARANLKVVAVGDIDAVALAALVDRTFGSLPERNNPVPVADVTPQGLGTSETVELEVPQTVITFGGLGLKRADPDFIPAFVLNHILGGGGFESRLFREVREKRGLAYSVYSYLAPFEHAGLFLGGVSTRNERAAETLDIIVAQINQIAAEGPSAEELEKAKRFLIGSYPLRFDTSGKITANLLDIQIENLGVDYIDKRNTLIEAVTADDIRRAARRFLAEVRLLVVLVGQPEGKKPLRGG